MTRHARRLVLVAAVLASLAAPLSVADGATGSATGSATGTPAARAAAFVSAHPAVAGFGARQALVVRDVVVDADGTEHVRFDRTVRGLRVVGGDFVLHLAADGTLRGVSRASLARLADAASRPVVTRAEAGAAAVTQSRAVRPVVRSTALVVYARATARLAWDVLVVGLRIDGTPSRLHVIVDARTGAVLDSWDGVNTDTGTGTGFFSGTVTLTTRKNASGSYDLVDPSRGNTYTIDKNNTVLGTGPGVLFTDADNVWGDGTLGNRQTVAVDAQYGTAQTWDYYLSTFGRNGIANNGVGAYNRVHYMRRYNNASWSDGCFCMTYGDGDGTTYNPFVSLDVAGHEMSHGVTSRTAALVYSGESGGLNEGTSDIFGSMVEFYANNPNDKPDFYIGEKLFKNTRSALRAMNNPALDGKSPNCYYSGVGNLDVHYSSGIANHFYYLLSQGSAATPPSPTCNGSTVVGIGRFDAQQIWYRALTVYMTSTTNYAQARQATLAAASDLFGGTSTQAATVNAAWAAVSVGP